MQLTREADYAIRTMLEVAASSGEAIVTTATVAQRRLVPRPILRKIVPRLVDAGLLLTTRGNHGGLALARPAEDIDLLTIIHAVQRPLVINRCVGDPRSCPLQPTCPVHEVCLQAHAQLGALFAGVSLAALVRRATEIQREPRRREPSGRPLRLVPQSAAAV